MGVPGFATGGQSGFAASRVYEALPFRNYREVGTWINEFVDAFGYPLDIWWARFVGGRFDVNGRHGRTALLDPTHTPAEVATETMATATAAPTGAMSQHTMLDILLYAAGVPWPVDNNLTTVEKQTLAALGWDPLRYKGTRQRFLTFASKVTDGVIAGWTSPPFSSSLILGDGAPSPGYGDWSAVPVTQAGTVATTSGSATVTGTSTAFVTDGTWNGLKIYIGTKVYFISSVTNATTLTLSANASATVSGQAFKVAYSSSFRPWLLQTIRDLTRRIYPAWSELGVGYSQFRAGYSGAGETVFPSGARLSILSNEEFATWTAGTPDSWTKAGAGTLTQATAMSSPVPQISPEFSDYAAQIDLSAAAAGVGVTLSQTTTAVNNQEPHRLQVDYSYTNTPLVSTLTAQITDSGNDQTYYWNPTPVLKAGTITITAGLKSVSGTGTSFDTMGLWTGMLITAASGRTYKIASVSSATALTLVDVPLNTETSVAFSVTSWTTAVTSIQIPVCSTAIARARYACDVIPQSASATSSLRGTAAIGVTLSATSDGTATTKVVYSLYRVALHRKHDFAIEAAASGERTLWLPLKDALGWSSLSRTGTEQLVEPSNYSRNSVKLVAGTAAVFEHHPALGARGYRSSSAWTNLIKGSNDFNTDWAAYSGGITVTAPAAGTISPIVGETVATAPVISHTAVTDYAGQSLGIAPTSNSYLAGIWLKRTTAEQGNQAGTVTITAGSATVAGSGTAFSAAWIGADIKTSAGYVYKVAAVASAISLTLESVSGQSESSVTFKLSDVVVQLVSTTTKSVGFFIDQADGWKLCALPSQTFGAGDVATLNFRLRFPSRDTDSFGAFAAYCYSVTGTEKSLYPPVCISPVGSTGAVAATALSAQTSGANALDPLLLRAVASVSRGALDLTVVPTYGAASQPNSTIFDVGQNATTNRVFMDISSGTIRLGRRNSATTETTIGLALTTNSDPASSQATWLRDTAIRIRARWSDDGAMSLSVGSSTVSGTGSGTYSDTSVGVPKIGCDLSNANQFNGIITALEIVQVGAPVT